MPSRRYSSKKSCASKVLITKTADSFIHSALNVPITKESASSSMLPKKVGLKVLSTKSLSQVASEGAQCFAVVPEAKSLSLATGRIASGKNVPIIMESASSSMLPKKVGLEVLHNNKAKCVLSRETTMTAHALVNTVPVFESSKTDVVQNLESGLALLPISDETPNAKKLFTKLDEAKPLELITEAFFEMMSVGLRISEQFAACRTSRGVHFTRGTDSQFHVLLQARSGDLPFDQSNDVADMEFERQLSVHFGEQCKLSCWARLFFPCNETALLQDVAIVYQDMPDEVRVNNKKSKVEMSIAVKAFAPPSEMLKELATTTMQVCAETVRVLMTLEPIKQTCEILASSAIVFGDLMSGSCAAQAMTRRQRSRQRVVPTVQLSKCAHDYLEVLENPFSGKVACVPTLTNFPTMKHSVRAQGTFLTGTLNIGYVILSPFIGMWNGQCVNYSDGTYNGTGFWNGGAGENGASTNSPYAPNTTENQVTARLVAAGLRVRNVTPALLRGGSLVGLESLGHSALTGQLIPEVMLQDTAERMPSDHRWHSVVFHPQDDDEFDYFSEDETQTDPYNRPILGFIAQTSGTNQQTFEWEAYIAFEAKGSIVHGLTPSMSDPTGLAAVQNASSAVAQRKPQTGEREGFVRKIANAAGDLLRSVLPAPQTIVDQLPTALRLAGAAYQYYRAPNLPRLPAPQRQRVMRRARITELADASSLWVAFPAILPNSQMALYAVSMGEGPFTGGVDSHKYNISGYQGKLFRSAFGDLVMTRVDENEWAQKKFRRKEGPLVTGQSAQFAVEMLGKGDIEPWVAVSGEFHRGRLVRPGGYEEKLKFLHDLGIKFLTA